MRRIGKIRRSPEDIRFSRTIRERAGYACQRCGKQHAEKSQGLHAAHCFTRRIALTRHDPENALALCLGCHQHLDSHADEKERLFREKLGDEAYDALAARAHGKRDRVLARVDHRGTG